MPCEPISDLAVYAGAGLYLFSRPSRPARLKRRFLCGSLSIWDGYF